MKTFADFKRDAAKGNMSLELIDWYGKTDEEIPNESEGLAELSNALNPRLYCKEVRKADLTICVPACSIMTAKR